MDEQKRLHRTQALTLLNAWWQSVAYQANGSLSEHCQGGSIRIDLRLIGAPEEVLAIIRKLTPCLKDS